MTVQHIGLRKMMAVDFFLTWLAVDVATIQSNKNYLKIPN